MKNNYSPLMSAKTPQISGGGNSQHCVQRSIGAQRLTLQSIGAQYFTCFLGSSCRVWKYAACMLMVLCLGIGNMWGADRYIYGKTAVSSAGALTTSSGKNLMVRTSNDGSTYSNVTEFFTFDSNIGTSGGNVYMKENAATTNSSSAQLQVLKWKKNTTTVINWTNSKLKFKKLYIYALEGSSKAIKLTVSNGTNSEDYSIQKKAGSSQAILDVKEITMNFTSSTGISISVDNTEDLHALIFFEADDYVEITNGDTEAFQGESIPMYANTTGVEWSVTSGASITSAGVLTIGSSTTGIVTVTCSKGGKSDTREITIKSGTTKDVTWNFSTLKGGAVYATGVQSAIAASDVSYEGGYVNMVANWVGVDVSSTEYKITAVSFNVRTPSSASKKIDYDYLTSGSKSAQGTYTTTTTNYETGSVASIDDKTAFRLWKNGTTTQVKSLTLTLKRTLSCTTPDAPTAFGKTDVTANTATFSITDAGDAASYDLYYASGTPSAPTGSTTATTNVSTKTPTIESLTGGTTYKIWVRSVCDADHKSDWVALGTTSFTTLADPEATFSDGIYVLEGSALDLSSLFTHVGPGTVTYNITDAGGTSATLAGSSFSATTAGTATVQAVLAAAGDYAGATKTAKVRVVAAPTHLIENRMATSGTWDSYILTNNDHISNLKTIQASEGKTLIKSGKESASGGRTPGITSNSSATLVENDYIYIQFTIESGYELTLSEISVPVFKIANSNGNYVARISDASNSIESEVLTLSQNGTGNPFNEYDFSSSPKLSGTVTLKLFAYGWSDGYRMESPIYVDGTIAAVGACTTPTITWDGTQPENAYVSDGSKTFVMNSNYAAGIAPELSENTCGATIAVKAGTDKKQWVVSFTSAGSVKITPKVVGDGTTVCAETVSGTAKTLTVTQAYDVTFNMNGHGAAIAKQVVADGAKAKAPFVADVADWVFGGWFTDAGCTAGNEFDFANTTITANIPLYAKWTADACAGDRKSLSKVVLASESAGTVTGYNGKEYAGDAVIGGLSSTETADVDASHDGVETGYKLNCYVEERHFPRRR